ncbi:hypothetical protein C2845_PM04G26200 [Panicum miliaceum]|uniref:F-box domain-containing protein n=1 Tax=Panicum miliaceum TaxID=4540 RepID=A0A3L6QTY1_PANMI|nr:hypothetical protein C2845_PM04G26200 [Panicum miliaceum]
MALPPRPDGRLPEATAPPVDGLTDDLLAAILIRLPTLADFGRAAAACPAFRRVIADPAFLRRVRALHPSLLLGFLTFTGGFRPAEPPYASVPAARAVARAADFSYSFLPRPSGWVVHDGRVLLDRNDGGDGIFTKLAVCDPLFRRYVVLPPIPEDLAAAVQQPHLLDLEWKFEVFLVPSDQEVARASFRVVWMAQCPTKLASTIVEAGEGRLGMFSFNARFGESFELDIFSTVRPNQGEGANEWKTLRGAILPYQYRYRILGVANTRLLIQGDLEFIDEDFLPPNVEVLSIALNTDYESVCGMIDEALHPLPLIGYPPSLSSLSI